MLDDKVPCASMSCSVSCRPQCIACLCARVLGLPNPLTLAILTGPKMHTGQDKAERAMRRLERDMQDVLNNVFRGRFQLFMEGGKPQ